MAGFVPKDARELSTGVAAFDGLPAYVDMQSFTIVGDMAVTPDKSMRASEGSTSYASYDRDDSSRSSDEGYLSASKQQATFSSALSAPPGLGFPQDFDEAKDGLPSLLPEHFSQDAYSRMALLRMQEEARTGRAMQGEDTLSPVALKRVLETLGNMEHGKVEAKREPDAFNHLLEVSRQEEASLQVLKQLQDVLERRQKESVSKIAKMLQIQEQQQLEQQMQHDLQQQQALQHMQHMLQKQKQQNQHKHAAAAAAAAAAARGAPAPSSMVPPMQQSYCGQSNPYDNAQAAAAAWMGNQGAAAWQMPPVSPWAAPPAGMQPGSGLPVGMGYSFGMPHLCPDPALGRAALAAQVAGSLAVGNGNGVGGGGRNGSVPNAGARASAQRKSTPTALANVGALPADGEQEETLRTHLHILHQVEAERVLLVRKINRLGFGSAPALEEHCSKYGKVERVLVAHSRVKSLNKRLNARLRPSGLGFVIMSKKDEADSILALGPEQEIAGAVIRVQRFQRRAHDKDVNHFEGEDFDQEDD